MSKDNTASKTNSKSGTPSTKATKKNITAADICRIIDACGQAGVSLFVWGDIEVRFEKGPSQEHPGQPMPLTPVVTAQAETPEENTEEQIQEQLDELMLRDPAAFERVIEEGLSE